MPVITAGSNIYGLIYNNQIKFWNKKLIAELSDTLEEEIKVSDSVKIKQDEKLVIKGPMNCLFPTILREMIYNPNNIGYISALKNNIIEPY